MKEPGTETSLQWTKAELVKKIEVLWPAEEFGEILRILGVVEEFRELDSSELLVKANALMLAPVDPDDSKTPFAEVESVLKKALEIDSGRLLVLIELAEFYYLILGDPQRAIPFFEKALAICRDALTTVASGYVDCLEETVSEDAAVEIERLRSIHESALVVENLCAREQRWLNEGEEE